MILKAQTIKTNTLENIIAITPIVLMVLFINLDINLNIDWNLKIDTLLIIFGNFAIAFYIASIINTKNKNHELKIENCYKELESLEKYLENLSSIDIKKPDEHLVNRYSSLINLQIDLIRNYAFIKNEHINTLKKHYASLNKELTDSNTINENFKNTILLIEKRILVIKSDIL